MSTKNNGLVDFSSVHEMLYGEEKFIGEFSEAAIQSFSEFQKSYKEHLLARDETNFRKAGHKIKPVAQMLGLDQILKEYEYAKTLLWDDKSDEALRDSVQKIDEICAKVLQELKAKLNQE